MTISLISLGETENIGKNEVKEEKYIFFDGY